jgi:hypothetical protein
MSVGKSSANDSGIAPEPRQRIVCGGVTAIEAKRVEQQLVRSIDDAKATVFSGSHTKHFRRWLRLGRGDGGRKRCVSRFRDGQRCTHWRACLRRRSARLRDELAKGGGDGRPTSAGCRRYHGIRPLRDLYRRGPSGTARGEDQRRDETHSYSHDQGSLSTKRTL